MVAHSNEDFAAVSHAMGSFATLGLPNTNRVVGIALNGVLIFTSISSVGLDPFFP
jgi:hypothetical protein